MLTAADPVIAGLAKDSDMRSKAIFDSTADVPERAIARYVLRCIIESLIYRCIGRVDRVVSGTPDPRCYRTRLSRTSDTEPGLLSAEVDPAFKTRAAGRLALPDLG
jgi:hypothetical protein